MHHLAILHDRALSAWILNELRSQLKVVAVKARGFVHNRKSILRDLDTFTRRTVFSDELDIKIAHYTDEMLRSTSSVYIIKEDFERRGCERQIRAHCV